MKTLNKRIPNFKNENAERKFWDENKTSDFFDFKNAKKLSFPNLKFSTETISLRLPLTMLNQLKQRANSMDVPYQSFIKMILAESLDSEIVSEGKVNYRSKKKK